MPTNQQILSGLSEITNEWQFLALVWHIYFGMLVIALFWGVRPQQRLMGILLALPLLSVSALAWITANLFNGAVFGLVGLLLIGVAFSLSRDSVMAGPPWVVIAGIAFFLFGWIYPHFLDMSSLLTYLYAAPTGLIPCPTLSIVIGTTLILGGLGSRAWSFTLGATGIFYAIFGAAHLGVAIDWILLAGTLLLFVVAIKPGLISAVDRARL